MKNVVLCFDQMRHHPDVGDGTNAAALFRLLDESEHQTGWYHTGTPRRARQRDALADARTTVRKAYAFVVRNFEPDDRILVFGTGRGGYCAQALTRLLGTVGILPPRWDDLVDFFVSAYGLPRTRRTPREWARITQLAAELNGGDESAIPVAYLGLWDALRPHALPDTPAPPVSNVLAGRHAMAVDGGPFGHRLMNVRCEGIEEVWFRGGHCDVAGGAGACEPLADISLDWVLDGAVAAGALLRSDHTSRPPLRPDRCAGRKRPKRLPATAAHRCLPARERRRLPACAPRVLAPPAGPRGLVGSGLAGPRRASGSRGDGTGRRARRTRGRGFLIGAVVGAAAGRHHANLG